MEAKEILSLIGLEETEGEEMTLDTVRDYMNNTFVSVGDIPNRKDIIEPLVKAGIGQRIGSLQTKFISSAKDLGVEINHADFKDKPIEDLLPAVFGGISEKLKSVKPNDSKLQSELDRVRTEYEQLANEVPKYESKIEEITNAFQTEKTNWLKNHAENEAWKKVTFAPTTKELEKVGFTSKIKSMYESMVDEKGEIYPVYKSGDNIGSRVKNPKKVTEYLKWEDLLLAEAEKEKLLPDAHAGKPTKPAAVATRTAPPTQPPTGARKMHPSFLGQ